MFGTFHFVRHSVVEKKGFYINFINKNMFQASGVMPSYELMKSAEQNEVLNKIVSGKKVFY